MPSTRRCPAAMSVRKQCHALDYGGRRHASRPSRDAALRAIGKKIVHQGGPGTGQQAKLCNQIVIAGTMVGVCESLLYG